LWIPLAVIALAAFAAWVGFGILSFQYEKRAEEFDLSKVGEMESASILYDRNGNEFGKLFIQNRQPVPFDKLPQMLVKAVIAAEDNKFYEHDGVDYMGILRAAIANYRRGKFRRGRARSPEQLARNSFELRERTYQRKLVEMFLAWRIEKNFTKDRIMELDPEPRLFREWVLRGRGRGPRVFRTPGEGFSTSASARRLPDCLKARRRSPRGTTSRAPPRPVILFCKGCGIWGSSHASSFASRPR